MKGQRRSLQEKETYEALGRIKKKPTKKFRYDMGLSIKAVPWSLERKTLLGCSRTGTVPKGWRNNRPTLTEARALWNAS